MLREGGRMWPFSKPLFKSELLFGRGFYYYLMASNLVLRLAWTYKLSPHLRRNHDTVLAFTLLEVPLLNGLMEASCCLLVSFLCALIFCLQSLLAKPGSRVACLHAP
jgi:hypothetical protein